MLVLQRVSGRSWRLIYKIDQRWVKNNRDPDNIVYVFSSPLALHCVLLLGADGEALSSFGAAAKEHEKLFYNYAGFLLAMAVADDALFGYESLEDVRAQEIPSGQDELVLRFKDSALERPILRKCTKTGGVTDDPMPKSSFTTIFKSTLTNAGYLCGPSIHAIRRQLGKGVDSKLVPFVTMIYLQCRVILAPLNRSPGDADPSISVPLLTPRLRTAYCRPALTTPNASRSTSVRSELRGELLLGRWPGGFPG